MARLKIKDQVNQIKEELKSFLRSIFGVSTNQAPLVVQSVFEESQKRIEESLALQEVFNPQIEDYIKSLNVPDDLKNIDFDSALELVKNDVIDFKRFEPILKSQLSNDVIKDILKSTVPGAGNPLGELGTAMAHITGKAQKAPDFVQKFLVSDARTSLSTESIESILHPTFTSLDQSTRQFVASATFVQEPTDILDFIQIDQVLPEDLAQGLLENIDNREEYLQAYAQQTDLTTLTPEVANLVLNGALIAATPPMITFVAMHLPGIALAVRSVIGAGNLSGLVRDASDFITYPKLDTLTNTVKGYISQVISKVPITQDIQKTIGKVIENSLDLTSFLGAVNIHGLENIDLAEFGMESFTVQELNNLLSSDLDLTKITRQINKLNFSQLSNSAISSLINQGATQNDLFKLGHLLDSGFGGKLDKITDLIGSGSLGNSIDAIEGNVNRLKDSFLGLTILGTIDQNLSADQIVKEIVAILPVGNQNLDDLLSRIGPVINNLTHTTLEEKGNLFTKATHIAQKKFPRDFQVRGPAQKQPKKKPYDDRSPYKGEGDKPGQDIPKVNKTETPEPGSYNH